MPVHLESAQRKDLPAIAALMNAAFRGPHSERSWSVESEYMAGERTNAALLAEEVSHGACLLLARDPETLKLVACVSLRPCSPQTWYLGSLAVDPAIQNAGFGREVLNAAEQFAAQQGARTVEITVIQVRETLVAWYERRGYTLTGEQRPFPYGDDRFGKPLRDDLSFVVLQKRLS